MTEGGWSPGAVRARLESFAPYTGAGIVVSHIAQDASEIRVEMPFIRAATRNGDKHLPEWTLSILDAQGDGVASVLKTLYVRRKRDR